MNESTTYFHFLFTVIKHVYFNQTTKLQREIEFPLCCIGDKLFLLKFWYLESIRDLKEVESKYNQ